MRSADGGMIIVVKFALPFPEQIDVNVVPNNRNIVFSLLAERINLLVVVVVAKNEWGRRNGFSVSENVFFLIFALHTAQKVLSR